MFFYHTDTNDNFVMKVWVSPQKSKKSVGLTVKFWCEVDHHHDYSVEWRWNGQPLPNNSHVVGEMELVIVDTVYDNSGIYSCLVRSMGVTTGAAGVLEVVGE